jgi:hypothetical protein
MVTAVVVVASGAVVSVGAVVPGVVVVVSAPSSSPPHAVARSATAKKIASHLHFVSNFIGRSPI